VRDVIKAIIKDTRAEPVARWLVKRSRGISMPFALVKNEIYDRQASEVMKQVLAPDSNCVDIGCHKGQFLEEFLKYAPNGHHFAFEPIPHLAKALRDTFASVQVFELALSDKAGEASFFIVPNAPALSGLHKREFIRPEEPRRELKVRTERLDSVIPPQIKIDLLKVDVEGAEGLVISGGLDTIRRNRPYIILEHGSGSSSAFGTKSEDIYDALVRQCGLSVSLLSDWLSRKRPLTKHEFIGHSEWYFLAHPAH
jgi:FkbM family methyltransferase